MPQLVQLRISKASVLACSYATTSAGCSELNAKHTSVPVPSYKLPIIKAQQIRVPQAKESQASEGRRGALFLLAATLFSTLAAPSNTSFANAGVIPDYLEKSKANKELNDKRRLASSGANFARAYTVQFGTCKFPENFTFPRSCKTKESVIHF